MNWNPNYRDVEVFSQCWKLFEAFWRAWSRIQVWLKSPGGQEAITNYITKSKIFFPKYSSSAMSALSLLTRIPKRYEIHFWRHFIRKDFMVKILILRTMFYLVMSLFWKMIYHHSVLRDICNDFLFDFGQIVRYLKPKPNLQSNYELTKVKKIYLGSIPSNSRADLKSFQLQILFLISYPA